jgi:hypothetical protein
MSGRATAWNRCRMPATLTVVDPIRPPPLHPQSTIRPLPSVSIHPLSTLAKRNRSAARSPSRSSSVSGGGGS